MHLQKAEKAGLACQSNVKITFKFETGVTRKSSPCTGIKA
jgi:hypothetical protein